MTTLPPHDSRVSYRASVHDDYSQGRVCGCQFGGLRAKPRVEIEAEDGTRLMVSPVNVKMAGAE